jgi:hypothetical protein
MLKDETGKIKVVFSNREPVLASWRGKEIELRCNKAQKGGWSGVKRSFDKQKNVAKLDVSDKAEVILFNEEHQPEPQQSPNGPAKGPSSPPAPGTPLSKLMQPEPGQNAAETARTDAATEMARGMHTLHQIANLQYAASTMVHEYLIPLLQQRGITIDPANEAKLVQNMLIQAFYEKIHYKFPGKKLGIMTRPQTPPTPPDGGPPSDPPPD